MHGQSEEWKALNGLYLEVGGVFRGFEYEIKDAIGKVNYSIVMDKLLIAKKVLDKDAPCDCLLCCPESDWED